MRKILYGTFSILILILMSVMFWVILLTPEKTLDGQYTQPFKYWTDNQYFAQNFIPQ